MIGGQGFFVVVVVDALGVLTVLAGVASFSILQHVRGFVRIVTTLSAGLLLLSGAYVVYYWLTAGRLLLA